MTSGIYHLNGHVGSSANFRRLRQRHPGCKITSLEFIPRLAGESDPAFSERLRVAEQRHLGKNGVAVGPDPLDFAPPKKLDMEKVRACIGPVTDETRGRMSKAKKGWRNPNSRRVHVTDPDGIEMEFGSVSEVAEFFRVSPSLMSRWLSDPARWPAPGKGSKVNRWVAGYRAGFKESCETSPEPQPTH